MKHALLSINPEDNSPRLRDFFEQSAEQWFHDRETVFLHVLQLLRELCSGRGLRSPGCFVCHARGDLRYERWLIREFVPLLKRVGISPTLDRIDNGPGASLTEFMDRIRISDLVLVVGTPLFYQKALPGSNYGVAHEVQRIADRLRDESKGNSVIPVLLAGEKQTSLPSVLWDRIFVDLRDMDHYHAEMFDLFLQMFGLLGDGAVQEWRFAIQDGRLLLR